MLWASCCEVASHSRLCCIASMTYLWNQRSSVLSPIGVIFLFLKKFAEVEQIGFIYTGITAVSQASLRGVGEDSTP